MAYLIVENQQRAYLEKIQATEVYHESCARSYKEKEGG